MTLLTRRKLQDYDVVDNLDNDEDNDDWEPIVPPSQPQHELAIANTKEGTIWTRLLKLKTNPLMSSETASVTTTRTGTTTSTTVPAHPVSFQKSCSHDDADITELLHQISEEDEEDWCCTPQSFWKQRLLYRLCWTLPILLWDALRLAVFVIVLSPGFASFLWYYVRCDRQVVPYRTGQKASWRHVVDIYPPQNQHSHQQQGAAPVVIFFTGGAWVIGYKMWGAFLAKVFAAFGVLVVVPDYPNYPWATVPDMVNDTECAIQWTLDNIANYGGDPNRILVAGQSAGGHLVSCVLLKKALQLLSMPSEQSPQTQQSTQSSGFHPTQLKGFCSISAPNDVQAMTTNFQKHGLDQSFVQSLFGVIQDKQVCMDDYDPQRLVGQVQRVLSQRTPQSRQQSSIDINMDMKSILPPMSIFHGTADQTVPYEVSEKFAASLEAIGVVTEYIAYHQWSHTDPILEGVMMADHRFHADLYSRLIQWNTTSATQTASHSRNDDNNKELSLPLTLDTSIPECQPTCPAVLVQAARFCNPF